MCGSGSSDENIPREGAMVSQSDRWTASVAPRTSKPGTERQVTEAVPSKPSGSQGRPRTYDFRLPPAPPVDVTCEHLHGLFQRIDHVEQVLQRVLQAVGIDGRE